MPVKIRLARLGAKKRPFYRIVAASSECRRDGRNLEILGTYNPIPDPAHISLKNERIQYWLNQGAIPTNTVKSILKKQDVYANVA